MMERIWAGALGSQGAVFVAVLVAAFVLPTVGLYSGGSYTAMVAAVSLAVVVSSRLVRHRCHLRLDPRLTGLMAAYLVVGWLAILWSVVPAATEKTALEMTLLALVLVPVISVVELDLDLNFIFGILTIAIFCGVIFATIDIAIYEWYGAGAAPDHYTVHRVVKYNRGVSYLEMMLWPMLAYYWLRGDKRVAFGLAGAVALLTVVSASLTAKIALLTGFAVLAVSLVATNGVFMVMGALVVLLGLAMPALLKAASVLLLGESLPLIKLSGIHRLEFWDYMADRVWDKPLFGWGLQSVPVLPIHPDELARYHVVTASGIGHAHNLWLQVWVEMGLIGAIIFLAFALYVLHKTMSIPVIFRPFSLAGYATILALTISTYNLAADSWWAAIAWSVFLFILVVKSQKTETAGA